MGKMKIDLSKRDLLKKKADKLKNTAVEMEADALFNEFKDIFGDDFDKAQGKMYEVSLALGEKKIGQIMAKDRHELYSLLLDNSIEDIGEYYEDKEKEVKE